MNIPPNAFVIDNSSMEKITTCPRAAKYYLKDKRELASNRHSLNFGTAVHAGLAARYGQVDWKEEAMVEALEKSFQTFEVPENDFRNAGFGIELIHEYNKKWPKEDFLVEAVEVPFAVPLGEVDGRPVIWTGKIDLAIRLDDGQLWLMDHKTSSVMGAGYFDQFILASQFLGYTYAYQILTGVKPMGAYINAIGLFAPSKTGKNSPKADKSEWFQRMPMYYSDGELQEWQADMLTHVEDYLRYEKNGHYPKCSQWCFGKYGKCQYFDVCNVPANQRDMVINSNLYKPVTWNPLESKNEEKRIDTSNVA